MSARLDTETLTQSNNIAASSVYYAMFWIKFNTKPLTKETIFSRKSTDGTQYVTVCYSADYEAIVVEVSDGVNPPHFDSSSNLFDDYMGVWKLVTVTYSATPPYRYIVSFPQDNGSSGYSFYTELDLSSLTYNDMVFGSGAIDIEVAYFREWAATLTEAEFIQEIQAANAVKAAITDTPLVGDLLDDSGNSNNWGSAPTLTYSASPTLPVAPSNNTEATALEISLPYEAVHTDVVSEGFVFDVWFKYTAVAGDTVVGEYFHATSGYNPSQYVYIDDSSKELKTYGTRRFNQTPLLVGRTYYWKLHANTNWPTATLTVSLLPAPDDSIQATGSIFIRTAVINASWITYGYEGTYAGYINPSTGEIHKFVAEFPPGDGGDALADGTMLISDELNVTGVDNRLVLYDPNLTELVVNIWPWYGFYDWPYIRACRVTNKFYVASREGDGSPGNNARFMTVTAAGVVSGDTDLQTGYITAIANSHDDLYVYVAANNPSILKKFRKSDSTYVADIAAAYEDPVDLTPYQIWDLLVMTTGEIVAIYQKNGFPTDFFVRVYSTAGAILNTYTGPYPSRYPQVAPRLGYATNSTSFWVFIHERPSEGECSRFLNLRLSDLAILTEITTPDVYYMLNTFGPVPPYRFVTSDSCPFVLAFPPDRSGIYYKPPITTTPPTYPPPTVRHDKYYNSDDKIPNPTIRTALFGE